MKILHALVVSVLTTLMSNLFAQSVVEKSKILFEANRLEEAANLLNTVNEKTADYAMAQYYLGRIRYQKKNFEEALEHFKNATEANPKSGEYFNWLGDTYSSIGANASIFKQMSVGPKAMRAWEEATTLDSKNISARVSLVGAYNMAPGFMGGGEDKAKAMAKEVFPLLDNSLKSSPNNYVHCYWYGKCAALTGLQLEGGETWLKKYLTHTPTADEPPLAGAYMRLAQVQEKQGKKAEAKKNYEMALKHDGKLKEAKQGFERVSN